MEEYIKEEGEHVPQSSWLASAFTGWNWNGPSNQDLLWTIQRNIILELAEKESCVIVGRCADFILRDKNCLRVFIHASMEKACGPHRQRVRRAQGSAGAASEEQKISAALLTIAFTPI